MEQSEVLDEKSFQDKYWFDNYVHITVLNPTIKDFVFQMMIQTGMDRDKGKPREESRTFRVPAGGRERFVGSVANLYLDKMSKLLAQQEENFGSIADWNARAKYYDDLIADRDDPFADQAFVPYDEASIATQKVEPIVEQAFSGAIEADEARKEKERADKLEQENLELRALLAEPKVEVVELNDSSPTTITTPEELPFAGVATQNDAPKRLGRPSKER